MIKIRTKYRTECFNCHQPFKVNDEVRWYKGKGVRCLEDCEERIKTQGSSYNWKHRSNRGVRLRSGRL